MYDTCLMAGHPLPIPDKKTKFNKSQFLSIAPRIWQLISPHKKNITIGMIALILASSINLSIPILIKKIIDADLLRVISAQPTIICVGIISIFIFQGVFFYLRHYHLQVIGLKIVNYLKNEMFEKLISHKISFFDESRSGDLLSRLNLDTDVLQKGISVNISVVLRYSVQVLVGIALMLLISPLLTSIIIGIIFIIACVSIRFSKDLKKASKETQAAIGKSIIAAEEAIHAIRVVKLFNTEHYEHQKYKKLNAEALQYGDTRIQHAAFFSSMMVTVLHISMAIVFIAGTYLVAKGLMNVGDLTAFLLYCTIVAISFGFLLNAWAEFVQSLGAAERIYSIIDGAHEIFSTDASKNYTESLPSGQDYDIQISNLSFSYPSRNTALVLDNISCYFPANKTSAIVGPSGSGKSTLVSLLPKLYDTYSGSIHIAGKDILTLSLEELRKTIAFVPQNPQLFSSTIRENIIYGLDDIDEIDLLKAIKDSALEELIASLPQGIETTVGDKGIQLSGGEKQRVSIARALMRNPKILVLDEATSALDSHNEHLIQNALERARTNRTVIIIAHRLSTVKNADNVIVLNKGQICQHGTHAELVAINGVYRDLVQYQLT